MSRCVRTIIPGPIGKLRVALCSDEMEALAIPGSEKAKGCFTQPQRLLQHCVEYRREVTGRRVDDLQHLRGRSLAGERLVAFRVADGKLTFEIGDPLLGID